MHWWFWNEIKDEIVFFPHKYFAYFFLSKACRETIHLIVQVLTALTHCIFNKLPSSSRCRSILEVFFLENYIWKRIIHICQILCYSQTLMSDPWKNLWRGLFSENYWGMGDRRLKQLSMYPFLNYYIMLPCCFKINILYLALMIASFQC